MRTVFLPTQNADMLLLKIESLQAQLNEQVRPPVPAVALVFCCVRHCKLLFNVASLQVQLDEQVRPLAGLL